MNVNKIIVHHSASKKTTTKSDIEDWHKERGFAEIGYHLVIGANGKKQDGRSTTKAGAHAKGANNDSLGVCLTGNFETETPDTKQVDALTDVLIEWCKAYKQKETDIYGHSDAPGGTTSTSCPGKNLESKLKQIRLNVKAKL